MTNDITVTDATETYHFVTHDISETGLSFVADCPYYFNPDKNLAITIRKKDEVANLKGNLYVFGRRDNIFIMAFNLKKSTSVMKRIIWTIYKLFMTDLIKV